MSEKIYDVPAEWADLGAGQRRSRIRAVPWRALALLRRRVVRQGAQILASRAFPLSGARNTTSGSLNLTRNSRQRQPGLRRLRFLVTAKTALRWCAAPFRPR